MLSLICNKIFRSPLRWFYFFLAGLILCFALNVPGVQVAAQSPPQEQLVQQGVERYQAGKFTEAIAIWEQALAQTTQAQDRAIIYSNLGVAYRQIGKLDRAIAQWEQAIQIIRSSNDEPARRQLAQPLADLAQAYSDLGQHQRAIKLLQSALEIASQNKDQLTEVAVKGALGNAYWLAGNYELALTTYQDSLNIARQLNIQEDKTVKSYITTALNNLGNVYVSRSERYSYQADAATLEGDEKQALRLKELARADINLALNSFEQSVLEATAGANTPIAEVRALLNLNHLLEKISPVNLSSISQNRDRILGILERVPDSRDKAYALINLVTGVSGTPLKERQSALSTDATIKLLEKAIAVARNIGDARAESFAMGSLGHLYEELEQYTSAMSLTQKAQFAAQQINADDSLYLWQWQAGRILKATGAKTEAIAFYEQAIATLQNIRSNIVVANKDLQFDFRDSVEPVYRELMAILLEPSSGKSQSSVTTGNIRKVVNTLELLKLAELENFFGDECVQVAKNNARQDVKETASKSVAFIYSVILGDRTEMLLQLPPPDQKANLVETQYIASDSRTKENQNLEKSTLRSYTVPLKQEQIQQEIDKLRLLLEKRATDEYISQSSKIYDLLIRPMAADIAQANIKTLVFIQDGALRKVPMSALYDGKQFLIEKYAIATTPSLSLTAKQSGIERQNIKALSVGLTVARPPFAALTNVSEEIAAVQSILGGTKLLDKDFTLNRLENELRRNNFTIVHMATHGQFGVDAASTILLSFDTSISIEQIDNLLRGIGQNSGRGSDRKPVELLTLSACQTAAGDNRSALGIAGVAVRAGVKSALASLWFINDEATVPLIKEFYTQLSQPNITKAEALQKAQLKLIASEDYSHPAVWSPFILIGNWI